MGAIKEANAAVAKYKAKHRDGDEEGDDIMPRADKTEMRLVDGGAKPQTYDESEHTVDAILSTGSEVAREFGREVLEVSSSAVDLSRLHTSGIPVLDSHNASSIHASLGRVTDVWFEKNKLLGRLKFHSSSAGLAAERMVANSEISGISIGYKINRWEISDAEGNRVDPERDRVRFDDDLTFRAVDWSLLETSLINIAADPTAQIRSRGMICDRALPVEFDPRAMRARMINCVKARMRMRERAMLGYTLGLAE